MAEKPVEDLTKLDLMGALSTWQQLQAEKEPDLLSTCQTIGNHILRLGEPIIAYDIVDQGLKIWPEDVRLQQLLALALARSGAVSRSLTILEGLKSKGHMDEETLGMLARVHKDLALQAASPGQRVKHLRQAYSSYAAAYQHTGGYWTGINAATMAALMGEQTQALTLAAQVRTECLQTLSAHAKDGADGYWLYATLGEAALILADLEGAAQWYGKAVQLAGRRYGDLASTRRNARLLMDATGLEDPQRKILEACFPISPVIVFAGHLIDQPEWTPPCFSAIIEEKIRLEIENRLAGWEAHIGYASAACSADILFLESMLARNGEIHVVLPFNREYFQKTGLNLIPDGHWQARVTAVLAQAARVISPNEKRTTGNPLVEEFANLVLDGLAQLRARMLDTQVITLACGDDQPGGTSGKTTSLVHHWRTQGREPEIIPLDKIFQEAGLLSAAASALPARPVAVDHQKTGAGDFIQEIKAILFADVVGYSALFDEQVPNFVRHFMQAMSDLMRQGSYQPLVVNTWGDALYFVFDSLEEAGLLALALRDRVSEVDWRRYGLPRELNLRISLHAGPVYAAQDPFLAGINYTGSHVNKAARIEPITPPRPGICQPGLCCLDLQSERACLQL